MLVHSVKLVSLFPIEALNNQFFLVRNGCWSPILSHPRQVLCLGCKAQVGFLLACRTNVTCMGQADHLRNGHQKGADGTRRGSCQCQLNQFMSINLKVFQQKLRSFLEEKIISDETCCNMMKLWCFHVHFMLAPHARGIGLEPLVCLHRILGACPARWPYFKPTRWSSWDWVGPPRSFPNQKTTPVHRVD